MNTNQPDIVDIFGSIYSFVLRYRRSYLLVLIIGFVFSLSSISLKDNHTSGEFVIRFGDDSHGDLINMVALFDKRSLLDGLRGVSEIENVSIAVNLLNNIEVVNLREYGSSNLKITTSYNADSLSSSEVEQALIIALRNNRNVREYIETELQLIDQELEPIELELESQKRLSSFILNNTEKFLESESSVGFMYADVTNLSHQRRLLLSEKSKLDTVKLLVPFEGESKLFARIKYVMLNIIAFLIIGTLFSVIHNVHRLYTNRKNN